VSAEPKAAPTACLPPTDLISTRDLYTRVLAIGKATFFRLKAGGRIGPRPLQLAPGLVRYDRAEIDAWWRCRLADGTLHTSETWPAVWQKLQRRQS
jgi:predicted DNA-binding transcriptional regulator AlpA